MDTFVSLGVSEVNLKRVFAARLFDIACHRTGLTTVALAERLEKSRLTVASWRKGDSPVPAEEFLTVCALARVWVSDLVAQAAIESPELLDAIPQDIDLDRAIHNMVVLGSLIASRGDDPASSEDGDSPFRSR